MFFFHLQPFLRNVVCNSYIKCLNGIYILLTLTIPITLVILLIAILLILVIPLTLVILIWLTSDNNAAQKTSALQCNVSLTVCSIWWGHFLRVCLSLMINFFQRLQLQFSQQFHLHKIIFMITPIFYFCASHTLLNDKLCYKFRMHSY